MNEAAEAELTREMIAARRSGAVMPAQALTKVESFADAYRLQDRVRDGLGARLVGWKLAAPAGADVISAPLFDIECRPSGAAIETALLRDGVECELALRIDRPLPAGCTRDDVMAAVGAVMPAFELLCSRLPAKFASPREHIVADGLGQGAVVLGAPCRDWRALDFDTLRVELRADDRLVADKQGGNPFGDPLRAVSLLAEHLASRGRTLEAGTFVLAGSHTGLHRPRVGERLRGVFEGLGEVAFTVGQTEEQAHARR